MTWEKTLACSNACMRVVAEDSVSSTCLRLITAMFSAVERWSCPPICLVPESAGAMRCERVSVDWLTTDMALEQVTGCNEGARRLCMCGVLSYGSVDLW